MEEIYERLPNEPLDMPDLDDLRFEESAEEEDDDDAPSGDEGNKLGNDVVEEFRRERLKDDEARL